MDFSSRNSQPSSASQHSGASFSPEAPAPKAGSSKKGSNNSENKWFKRGAAIFLIVLALLLIAIVALLFTTKPKSESSLVNTDQMQAVFLRNNQVYFGNITELNNRYLTLENIYYLQTSSTDKNAANNVSLVKLGCELHRPYDRMVINSDEVEFWENLQAEGQVAKAVAQFLKDNPNGQKCSDTTNNSSQTQDVQGSNQPANNSNTNTNDTTNNTNTPNTSTP